MGSYGRSKFVGARREMICLAIWRVMVRFFRRRRVFCGDLELPGGSRSLEASRPFVKVNKGVFLNHRTSKSLGSGCTSCQEN